MQTATLLLAARLAGAEGGAGRPAAGSRPHGRMRWEGTYPPALASVTEARHAAVAALRGAGWDGADLDATELVLGELIANAVLHAQTQFTVVAGLDATTARVEVIDLDARPPVLLALPREARSGRGLWVVDGLADAWGWEGAESANGAPSKRVWAEVRRAPGAQRSGRRL
jgi:hypothetical protein